MNAPASATDFDVVIVGGGLVGASLALALRPVPLRIALIEATVPSPGAAQPSFDDRTSALGNGTRRIFETLGVWSRLAANAAPIHTIHISDAGQFGMARLEAAAQGLRAFGYTVGNRAIGQALWEALRAQHQVRLFAPCRVLAARCDAAAVTLTLEPRGGAPAQLSARLAVAADGANSPLRQAAGISAESVDYHQVAVVAHVLSDRPAAGIAYERFTPSGPMAVLPRPDGAHTIVWALPPAAAAEQLGASDAEFLNAVQRHFGWRIGRLLKVGPRGSYPLALTRARAASARRVVLVGNAAQALHPVAGQGFNLGLRDAAVLAELIAAAADPGEAAVLAAFEQQRAVDRRGMIGFTDALVRGFADQHAALARLRSLGLLLFDRLPPAKRALSRLSWGFAPQAPRLMRGLEVR